MKPGIMAQYSMFITKPFMENKKKVLVLDDSASAEARTYLDGLRENYEVEVTTDDNELVSRVVRNEPDVIIVNNDIPNFDGFGICDLIKTARNIPIILIVGADWETAQSGVTCAADEAVRKPFTQDHIARLVEKYSVASRDRIIA